MASSRQAVGRPLVGFGWIYVVELIPDIAPGRVKVGITTHADPDKRVRAFRTTCPGCELRWAFRVSHPDAETVAHGMANRLGCRLGEEVWDVGSQLDGLLVAIEDALKEKGLLIDEDRASDMRAAILRRAAKAVSFPVPPRPMPEPAAEEPTAAPAPPPPAPTPMEACRSHLRRRIEMRARGLDPDAEEATS